MNDLFDNNGASSLELHPIALGQLLENTSITVLKLEQRCVVVEIALMEKQFISIGTDIISACGSFTFSTTDVQYTHLKRYPQSYTLSIWLKQECRIELVLHREQTPHFWNIFRSLSAATTPLSNIDLCTKDVCPCCKERENMIRQETAQHPVSQIIQSILDRGTPLKVAVTEGPVKLILLQVIESINFEEGHAIIHSTHYLDLPIEKIHFIQIAHETIDETVFSRLKVFNSFAKEIFNIGCLGKEHLQDWHQILNSGSFYQKS